MLVIVVVIVGVVVVGKVTVDVVDDKFKWFA